MHPTRDLAKSPLFQLHPEGLSLSDRIQVTYERAKAIGKAYALTTQDLLLLSPRFWQLHTDPIWSMDGAAGTLNTLQYNCCGGTLAMFAKGRSDVADILQQVLEFNVSGQYCLTEVGHGLDAFHLETTATLLPNGDFELHTPSERAAKYMPPTAPMGMPCVAIVFARALIEGEDRGVKPFLVHIHNGKDMNKGIVCKVLPQRGGSRPMNHSLTYFNHVRLPYSALLGSVDRPINPKMSFFHNISRVAIGTIAIGSLGVPALQVASFIAAKYSIRRTVVNNEGQRKPIMDFRTQKIPIVTAVAQSFVMQALHNKMVLLFRDVHLDYRVRHAIASILKVVMIQHAQAAHLTLGDRCGAQGLFEVNQLTAMHADMRGTAIAEGDLLGISIRFATELLLRRYAVPDAGDPSSLLAKHEAGLFEEMREQLAVMRTHRSPDFDRLILPECLNLVQAIGHRMAYDAAVSAGVDICLIDLYVASCVKIDAAWYVEKLGMSRAEQRAMENDAVDAVFPQLQELLERMDIEPYISAPMISDEKWSHYMSTLPTFGDTETLVHAGAGPLINDGLPEMATTSTVLAVTA
ncbi:acyl-CoA dehydrogenase NM domain-like protein [Fomitopsis serialis]|uniref:acyl-CoA dehydrogenase NM domain-like protein n=1 Tax=Fomitopsis serialis TaxID=139415 RepID=UPI002007A5A6|nr:acyl-CoA dehydrogenase NM domain-like protein [Neoantrodia serialis]KAH9918440.1 acyl-CoA dehydrogenase NM domain-like protein [Neoantrodia serialis]